METRSEGVRGEPGRAEDGPPAIAPARAASGRRALTTCLLAGLAAGALAAALGEATAGAFEARGVKRQFQGVMSDLPTAKARDAAATKNAALAGAGLGALLGLALGLAGGLLRGEARRGLAAGGVGLALGGLVGAGLPAAVFPAAIRLQDRHDVDPLLAGTAAQMIVAGLTAAAAGAAFGIGRGGIRDAPRPALHGLVGGLVGAVVFAALGAALFPLAETDRPQAIARAPRMLAMLLPAIAAGAAVGLSAVGRRGEAPAPATPAAS